MKRWLGLAVLAAGFATAMGLLSHRSIEIELEAEEPAAPKDEFPFSPRPNRAREIKWRKWSPEVFAEATKADKPVAISLTATWCQKCHEMDEGAFSDARVIELLNAEFVCIRVDTDRHPEIKDRYLSNRGWPTTAFCAPTGDVMTKVWFMPGDEFLSNAKLALENYRLNKADILRKAKAAYETPRKRDPADAALAEVDAILKGIDATWAADGSGWAAGEFRFPSPANIELCIWKHGDSGEKKWLDRAVDGAACMLKIEDPVEFGFYRVAMKPDWSDPHFEKLLETNAAMLHALSVLWRATGDEKWGKAASRVVEWMNDRLRRQAGGWQASQDADPDYFVLDRAGREKRRTPHVDPAFYSGLNGQAASAYIEYGAASGSQEALDAALAALEGVFAELWSAEGLRHVEGGDLNQLRDLALVGDACLDAAQATGAPVHVTRAGEIAARILTLADTDGGLFDRPPDPNAPGHLKWPMRKSADNGRAASFLVRLHHVTGDEKWKTAAEAALKAIGGEARKYPAWSAEYALAVARLRRYPLHVVVCGPAADLPPMVARAHRFWHPWKTVTVLASDGKPVQHAGLEYGADLAAYVCVAEACGPPVTSPEDFDQEVRAFLQRNK